MKWFAVLAGLWIGFVANGADAASVYLNTKLISVKVGPQTGKGTSNNTLSRGFGIEKVIDAPTADSPEFHNQDTHIWYTFENKKHGLELIFNFNVSYDITDLHFWNYISEDYDVDRIVFTFFDSVGTQIGKKVLTPKTGSSPGIMAENYVLQSPLNTRMVSALLTGSNGQVDFQNIGFTALISDSTKDPDYGKTSGDGARSDDAPSASGSEPPAPSSLQDLLDGGGANPSRKKHLGND